MRRVARYFGAAVVALLAAATVPIVLFWDAALGRERGRR